MFRLVAILLVIAPGCESIRDIDLDFSDGNASFVSFYAKGGIWMKDDATGHNACFAEASQRALENGDSEARVALIINGAQRWGELTRTNANRTQTKQNLIAQGYAENNLGQWIVDMYFNTALPSYQSPNGIPVRLIPVTLDQLAATNAAEPLHAMVGTGGAYLNDTLSSDAAQGSANAAGWEQFKALARSMPVCGNSAFLHPHGPWHTGIPAGTYAKNGDGAAVKGEGLLPMILASHVADPAGWARNRDPAASLSTCNLFDVLAETGSDFAVGVTNGAVARITPSDITIVRANPDPGTRDPAGAATYIYRRAGLSDAELKALSLPGACSVDGKNLIALSQNGETYLY